MVLGTARTKLGAGLVATLATAALTASAAPASASAADGVIYGKGYVKDDWGDEGTLSTGSYSSSGATCLWQKIVESEGYTLNDGPDGHFGFETKEATRRLQVRWGLADSYANANGKVGPKTFGAANKNLRTVESNGEWRKLTYKGKVYSFTLFRGQSGGYHWYVNNSVRYAYYNSNACD